MRPENAGSDSVLHHININLTRFSGPNVKPTNMLFDEQRSGLIELKVVCN
jgi:hypothetical protein